MTLRFAAKTLRRVVIANVILMVALLAGATIVEKFHGAEWVHRHIYGVWWVIVLWIHLAVFSFLYIFACRLWRRPAAFLLHCAFGVILLGALVTYLGAERGYVHIRQGETANSYTPEDDGPARPLPFGLKLVLFDVEYHPGGDKPADYISYVKTDDGISRISMNRILRRDGYRFCQYDYDPDEMGTVLLVNRDPWGTGVTYAGYLLLAAAMLWLLWLRIGWKGLLWTFVPTAVVWLFISQLTPMTPVLRTPLLGAHVSVIMVSYALLLFFMITGITGLCSQRLGEKFYRWNSQLIYPAVFLLAAGIFIGAVWANISWGRYWGWDAKETWALVTMLIYAVPMHPDTIPALRKPRNFHLYCTVAFLAVAMTFFGVTYLLGGMHSYVN